MSAGAKAKFWTLRLECACAVGALVLCGERGRGWNGRENESRRAGHAHGARGETRPQFPVTRLYV